MISYTRKTDSDDGIYGRTLNKTEDISKKKTCGHKFSIFKSVELLAQSSLNQSSLDISGSSAQSESGKCCKGRENEMLEDFKTPKRKLLKRNSISDSPFQSTPDSRFELRDSGIGSCDSAFKTVSKNFSFNTQQNDSIQRKIFYPSPFDFGNSLNDGDWRQNSFGQDSFICSSPIRNPLSQKWYGYSPLNNIISPIAKISDKLMETVNNGKGIKNPLLQDPTIQFLHTKQDMTVIQKGSNEFICRICNKTFPLQRMLSRHIKCHREIKRYLCSFCGKGFNDTFDLKRHTRTHTGVRPYKCEHCDKAFTQRCSLESHSRKIHKIQFDFGHKERRGKVYVCEECGHTTNQPEVLNEHLKIFHPNLSRNFS